MTASRFDFQRNCVLNTDGLVLNIGANEDPAGLKALAPDRVINCDIEEFDSFLDGRPNRVDMVFDARQPWPFKDDEAELVVLGDILEHLLPDEAEMVLLEANRVAQTLCITVPEDDRFLSEEHAPMDGINQYTRGVLEAESGYRTHCHVVTRDYLVDLLRDTGWTVSDWHTVNYDFVPVGYFVLAERQDYGIKPF